MQWATTGWPLLGEAKDRVLNEIERFHSLKAVRRTLSLSRPMKRAY